MEPGEIDGNCGCYVGLVLHNNCDSDLFVTNGDSPGRRCPDDPAQPRCHLVAPGETREIGQAGGVSLSFPLWKDDVLHEIVAEVELEFE